MMVSSEQSFLRGASPRMLYSFEDEMNRDDIYIELTNCGIATGARRAVTGCE